LQHKDYSCVKGFCPSFVTVHGGELKKGKGAPVGDNVDTLFPAVQEPELPALEEAYGVLVNGIGGTGVVTIGAIVGMAAHLEGKAFNALDMAGLAQKGGAVWSHLQIAREQSDIGAARIGLGGAKAMIGCDFVTSASETSMEMVRHGRTRALVNLHQQMTGEFTRDINAQFPAAALKETIANGVGEGNAQFVEGTRKQYVHARDGIPEWTRPDWQRSDQQSNRTQRRCRKDEPDGVPVGSPGSC
jgi:indolepyruvate ferredoxin oxidoreductase